MECSHLEENAMITAANIHVEAALRRCSGWLPKKHTLNLTLFLSPIHFDSDLCVWKTANKILRCFRSFPFYVKAVSNWKK